MSVDRLKKGKQNAESPSTNCRKEKVDIQSISKNRQSFENQTAHVSAVYYTEGESKELQRDYHKDVETVASEALYTDWRERVSVGEYYDRERQDMMGVLDES